VHAACCTVQCRVARNAYLHVPHMCIRRRARSTRRARCHCRRAPSVLRIKHLQYGCGHACAGVGRQPSPRRSIQTRMHHSLPEINLPNPVKCARSDRRVAPEPRRWNGAVCEVRLVVHAAKLAPRAVRSGLRPPGCCTQAARPRGRSLAHCHLPVSGLSLSCAAAGGAGPQGPRAREWTCAVACAVAGHDPGILNQGWLRRGAGSTQTARPGGMGDFAWWDQLLAPFGGAGGCCDARDAPVRAARFQRGQMQGAVLCASEFAATVPPAAAQHS
jgi:hypothetical protein